MVCGPLNQWFLVWQYGTCYLLDALYDFALVHLWKNDLVWCKDTNIFEKKQEIGFFFVTSPTKPIG